MYQIMLNIWDDENKHVSSVTSLSLTSVHDNMNSNIGVGNSQINILQN